MCGLFRGSVDRSAVQRGCDLVNGEEHDAVGRHRAQQARREALVEARDAALLKQPLQRTESTYQRARI